MTKNSKINGLFFALVVWDYYFAREQSLVISLCKNNIKFTYVEPVEYSGKNKSLRIKRVSKNLIPKDIDVVSKKINLNQGLLLLFLENLRNLYILIKIKPDFVVVDNYFNTVLVCLYCYFKKVTFIFDLIDDWELVEKKPTHKFFWKYISKPIFVKYSSAITTTSTKQYLLFKKIKKSVFYMPNGKLINNKNKKNTLKSEEIKQINFIGTLRDWFDFDLLFEVMKEFPNIKLDIYGDGNLKDYLIKKSLSIKNIFIHESVNSNTASRLIAKSDIGIIPLKKIPLNDTTNPVKLYDYWSEKKAVIATPTFELKKIANGSIIFASTKQDYINAIKKLQNSPNFKNYLGNKGFDKVKNKFNYEKIGKKYADIIRKIIQQP
ncbi:MAG: Glycosyl transferase, group 1 [Candidatus Pacebacteria bacterium GW2011_GWF2_38_9]|nr:MAG: glycosyltransferase [candidate division TM6 bacterium GW2011_GWF2_28_16]KKQ09321.1 MAG: Glycosyl transferase, group 1 [Candidatus Pacebacteria bacterium GW2011_GWF1_36_5]KKQ88855.1 MAG: Glycosyl transferase, group 1 [Candidatus Pacebacteria bacterium GW2011_GWF2_38_9]HAZ73448.1 hypothetical protein [Candidatus Paceibacterota bacterium]